MGNVLCDPDAGVERPEDVEHLDVEDNRLGNLSSLAPFDQLASANVSRNQITTLAHVPPAIERIAAASNRIASLRDLPHRNCLVELDVSRNPLASVRYRRPNPPNLAIPPNALPNLRWDAAGRGPDALLPAHAPRRLLRH